MFYLSGAKCVENRLIFSTRKAVQNQGQGKKASIETFLWDSWGDGDECKSAAKSLKARLTRGTSIVLIPGLRWEYFGAKVIRYYKYGGTCKELRKAFRRLNKKSTKKNAIDLPGLKEIDDEAFIKKLVERGAKKK